MKHIAAFIIGAVIIYLIGAFTAWDWNPGNWWWVWRGLIVIFAAIVGFVAAAVSLAMEKE